MELNVIILVCYRRRLFGHALELELFSSDCRFTSCDGILIIDSTFLYLIRFLPQFLASKNLHPTGKSSKGIHLMLRIFENRLTGCVFLPRCFFFFNFFNLHANSLEFYRPVFYCSSCFLFASFLYISRFRRICLNLLLLATSMKRIRNFSGRLGLGSSSFFFVIRFVCVVILLFSIILWTRI